MENLPGLSNRENRLFLGIADGKITYRPGREQSPIRYDQFEGHLQSIARRNTEINGSPTTFYDLLMVNSGRTYVLSLPYSSGVARTIILCLASIEDFTNNMVKIVPYKKDDKYTNVTVYVNGNKAKWVIEALPPVEKIVHGSKEYIDDSKRIEVVESYIGIINDRLQKQYNPVTDTSESPVVDVEYEEMPAELG